MPPDRQPPASDHGPADHDRQQVFAYQSLRFILQLIAVGAVTALCLALLWYAGQILLLTFGGIIVAVFLCGLAEWVKKWAHLPYGWSLTVVILVIIAIIGVACWLLSSSIASQLNELTVQIPNAIKRITAHIQQYKWGQFLTQELNRAGDSLAQGNVMATAGSFITGLGDALIEILLVCLVALYGAATPDVYVIGVLHLVPQQRRERVRTALKSASLTLWWWVICRIVSMVWVGVATTLGLWLLGIPMELALGIFAGLMRFVPYIGPWIAAVPAVLLAFVQGPWHVLYVAVLYIVIEAIDDHLILPLLNYRVVWLPPAIAIFAQVLFGALWGMIGVLFAMPVAAVIMVFIQMLYVEDTIGDQLQVIGQSQGTAQATHPGANGNPSTGAIGRPESGRAT